MQIQVLPRGGSRLRYDPHQLSGGLQRRRHHADCRCERLLKDVEITQYGLESRDFKRLVGTLLPPLLDLEGNQDTEHDHQQLGQ